MQELLDRRARESEQRGRQSDAYAPTPNPLGECQSALMFEHLHGGTDVQVGCAADGTLVRARFVDAARRSLVTETVNLGDGTHTFYLKNQNIKFVIDNGGKILSYSNGDHVYGFDPQKQKFERAWLPDLDISGTSAPKRETSKDLGDGLTVHDMKEDGSYTFRLPDGLKISLNQYNFVTKITKDNSFNYEMGGKHSLTQEDPNLPKDHRLHEPIAINQDAVAAMFLATESSKHIPLQRITAQNSFTDHMNKMPENKRVDYAKALQTEIDKLEKAKNFYDRKQLSYTVGKDGKLDSIEILYGSYVPYFSVPVERARIWHK